MNQTEKKFHSRVFSSCDPDHRGDLRLDLIHVKNNGVKLSLSAKNCVVYDVSSVLTYLNAEIFQTNAQTLVTAEVYGGDGQTEVILDSGFDGSIFVTGKNECRVIRKGRGEGGASVAVGSEKRAKRVYDNPLHDVYGHNNKLAAEEDAYAC